MSVTSKTMALRDSEQAIRTSYNDANATLGVDGFIVGKVGHKVVLTLATTSAGLDTEVYNFFDGSNLLYQITIIYTDATRNQLVSAERTA
jgi:hypothetical protein